MWTRYKGFGVAEDRKTNQNDTRIWDSRVTQEK